MRWRDEQPGVEMALAQLNHQNGRVGGFTDYRELQTRELQIARAMRHAGDARRSRLARSGIAVRHVRHRHRLRHRTALHVARRERETAVRKRQKRDQRDGYTTDDATAHRCVILQRSLEHPPARLGLVLVIGLLVTIVILLANARR
jgi:hypothetical protein